MHEQPVLQEDLSSSYSKKYKFLCYIIVVMLPQTNYSPICIQEREEKLAGSERYTQIMVSITMSLKEKKDYSLVIMFCIQLQCK